MCKRRMLDYKGLPLETRFALYALRIVYNMIMRTIYDIPDYANICTANKNSEILEQRSIRELVK